MFEITIQPLLPELPMVVVAPVDLPVEFVVVALDPELFKPASAVAVLSLAVLEENFSTVLTICKSSRVIAVLSVLEENLNVLAMSKSASVQPDTKSVAQTVAPASCE